VLVSPATATLNLGQSFALSIAAAISLQAAPVDAALAALAAVAWCRYRFCVSFLTKAATALSISKTTSYFAAQFGHSNGVDWELDIVLRIESVACCSPQPLMHDQPQPPCDAVENNSAEHHGTDNCDRSY
jgi:hypothetical protein